LYRQPFSGWSAAKRTPPFRLPLPAAAASDTLPASDPTAHLVGRRHRFGRGGVPGAAGATGESGAAGEVSEAGEAVEAGEVGEAAVSREAAAAAAARCRLSPGSTSSARAHLLVRAPPSSAPAPESPSWSGLGLGCGGAYPNCRNPSDPTPTHSP